MPAKNRGRYFFTEQQIQKYNRTIVPLGNLDCDASLELRKIGRSNLTNKRYQDAGVFFAGVAAQMTSALQFLVEILRSAQQPSGTPLHQQPLDRAAMRWGLRWISAKAQDERFLLSIPS
jgi:hypothetical protein